MLLRSSSAAAAATCLSAANYMREYSYCLLLIYRPSVILVLAFA